MDLLYRRYADPISFLSKMIYKGNFTKTITDIWNEAQEEKLFEMYLHSYSDKSFNEYKEEMITQNRIEKTMSKEFVKATIKESESILENFIPAENLERRID